MFGHRSVPLLWHCWARSRSDGCQHSGVYQHPGFKQHLKVNQHPGVQPHPGVSQWAPLAPPIWRNRLRDILVNMKETSTTQLVKISRCQSVVLDMALGVPKFSSCNVWPPIPRSNHCSMASFIYGIHQEHNVLYIHINIISSFGYSVFTVLFCKFYLTSLVSAKTTVCELVTISLCAWISPSCSSTGFRKVWTLTNHSLVNQVPRGNAAEMTARSKGGTFGVADDVVRSPSSQSPVNLKSR